MLRIPQSDTTGTGGSSMWEEPFETEVHEDLKFDHPGILAMANAGPNTNGSQFFITTSRQPRLNMRYTIFGEVVSGLEAVEAISRVETDENDNPLKPQTILKATVQPSS